METSKQHIVTILSHYDLAYEMGCSIFLVKFIVSRIYLNICTILDVIFLNMNIDDHTTAYGQ